MKRTYIAALLALFMMAAVVSPAVTASAAGPYGVEIPRVEIPRVEVPRIAAPELSGIKAGLLQMEVSRIELPESGETTGWKVGATKFSLRQGAGAAAGSDSLKAALGKLYGTRETILKRGSVLEGLSAVRELRLSGGITQSFVRTEKK